MSEVNPFHHVCEQFVDNAAFLWILRSVAINQPHYLPADILEIETRIKSNIDGMFSVPEDAWHLCLEALEFEEPGEVFTAAILAFYSADEKKIQKVVEVGLSNDQALEGLVSSIAWLPEKVSVPWLEKFIRSKDLAHKRLAINTYRHLRRDPGEYLTKLLQRDDCVADEKLYISCLRLAGELKRTDLVPELNIALNNDSKTIKFWASVSLALLGNRAVVEFLAEFIDIENPHWQIASHLYFRIAPIKTSRQLISELAKDEDQTRVAIKACAILGDPQVVSWLFGKMEDPELARVAAESFTHITGIFLEENKLDIDVEEPVESPEDDPNNDNVELDEDENLPWPDVNKVKVIWQKYGHDFVVGNRYFLGKEIEKHHLIDILANGFSRHRQHANIELSLLDPASPIENLARWGDV